MINGRLKRNFDMAQYPLRSINRLFVIFSICVYVGFRLVDPGPVWLISIIDKIVLSLNLEFFQKISLAAPQVTNLWLGSGFALKLQFLITWPLMLIAALISGWKSRNGSQEIKKFSPIIKRPSLKNWIKNLLPIVMILSLAYFPFYGTNINAVRKSTGLFAVLEMDTLLTSLFWIVTGSLIIHLMSIGFYIINSELKLTINKGI